VKELTICYGIWEGELKEFHQQPLWKLCIIVFTNIDLLWLIKIIAHWPPLYAKVKNILVKFTFYIYNQQLSFALTIPSSFYTNNDNNNGSKALILKNNSKFFNGIQVEKLRNQVQKQWLMTQRLSTQLYW